MEMTYGGTLVMPSSYAVMDEEEMMYLEGGKFTLDTALSFIAGAILGGVIYDVFKAAAIKVGAWAALKATAIITVVSRAVAITLLVGIAACYGAILVETYKRMVR